MAFIDKKYFFGFERILDFWADNEIKQMEDSEYRFVKCWEEGEWNDYISPNGRYYVIEKFFEFESREQPDYVLKFRFELIRLIEGKDFDGTDLTVSYYIDVKDKSADRLMHGYEKKYVDTTDVVMRTCYKKVNEIYQYILKKDKLVRADIEKINNSNPKTLENIKISDWIEKYIREYKHELEIKIRTKDKKIYFMGEKDYFKQYKLVKKFDGYNRKGIIQFIDAKTKEKVDLFQQDIKDYKITKNR